MKVSNSGLEICVDVRTRKINRKMSLENKNYVYTYVIIYNLL